MSAALVIFFLMGSFSTFCTPPAAPVTQDNSPFRTRTPEDIPTVLCLVPASPAGNLTDPAVIWSIVSRRIDFLITYFQLTWHMEYDLVGLQNQATFVVQAYGIWYIVHGVWYFLSGEIKKTFGVTSIP